MLGFQITTTVGDLNIRRSWCLVATLPFYSRTHWLTITSVTPVSLHVVHEPTNIRFHRDLCLRTQTFTSSFLFLLRFWCSQDANISSPEMGTKQPVFELLKMCPDFEWFSKSELSLVFRHINIWSQTFKTKMFFILNRTWNLDKSPVLGWSDKSCGHSNSGH